LQTLLIAHQALVCVLIILRLLIRLKDSFIAPKDVLQEFADLAEEENIGDPFAETKSQRQIASRQSEYHNRKYGRVAQESADAFKQIEDGIEVEGGCKDAIRLARLENEEARVKRAIEEKERKVREEGKVKMDLDKTPPAAEIDAAARELAAAKQSPKEPSSGTKRKRRWDVSEPTDENADPNEQDSGEWSKENLEASAPKKTTFSLGCYTCRCQCWRDA
jgi:splicing factor 3B subunit 1